jgi:hypothetical protein
VTPLTVSWLRAVRDHPGAPPAAQRYVLVCAALRLDVLGGTGRVSVARLAQDARVDERTVRRALAWARDVGLLDREQRGHRRGDGTAEVTQWRLRLPSQPAAPDRFRTVSTGHAGPAEKPSTGQPGPLNRTTGSAQPAARARLRAIPGARR